MVHEDCEVGHCVHSEATKYTVYQGCEIFENGRNDR